MSVFRYAAAQVIRALPRQKVSAFMGSLADYEWPAPLERAVVSAYSKAYRVSFDECERAAGFENFDAFFTRTLKPGARPIAADPRHLVSPADGRVESMTPIAIDSRIAVKGQNYRLVDLLGSEQDAERFAGGGACVVYLSPRDYHRVHSPVAGTLIEARSLPGDYFPVNSMGLRYVPQLFVRNRRVVLTIEPNERSLGRVAVVMVAALVVGRVTVTGVAERDVPVGLHRLNVSLERGDEIGQFHLGSTAVVLVESRAMGRWLRREGAVRYGESLLGTPEGA